MTIVTFENRREICLALIVEPWGDRYEIPHLAEAGIRYTLSDGAEDRCHSSIEEDRIAFWCDAESYEIDIVRPSAFARLCHDICVNGGWCGGLIDKKPITVDDLIPVAGLVSAREFAELAIRADNWLEPKPYPEKHVRWLEEKFVEHLGGTAAPVEELRRNLTRPFGDSLS